MNAHVMIDLETLGRGPGCRILSLGAVVMAPAAVPSSGDAFEFYLELDINDQQGLDIDPETWAWWQDQPPETRERLFANQESKPGLVRALSDFSLWLGSVAEPDEKGNLKLCVWGNGADFDNAILQYAYRAAGLPLPWVFWRNRCYRTLKGLVPNLKITRQGDHHNALDDARSQAAHAHQLVDHLRVSWHDL